MLIALIIVILYTGLLTSSDTSVHSQSSSRKLLGFGHNTDASCKVDEEDAGDVDNANCSRPLHRNNSCQFVKANCVDDVALFNYMIFIACDVPQVKV